MENDTKEFHDRPYQFIGKTGKYQIPKGAIVYLRKKPIRKRKCVIVWEGKEYITMVSLLRKL